MGIPFPAGKQTLGPPAVVRPRSQTGEVSSPIDTGTPYTIRAACTVPPRGNTFKAGAIMGILSWILFGGLAGLAAGFLTGRRGGIIYDIIVGIVGALLGGFLMGLFGHVGVTGWNWRCFAVAVGGAILLILILGAIRGRGRSRTD